jgi:hypothetical protein
VTRWNSHKLPLDKCVGVISFDCLAQFEPRWPRLITIVSVEPENGVYLERLRNCRSTGAVPVPSAFRLRHAQRWVRGSWPAAADLWHFACSDGYGRRVKFGSNREKYLRKLNNFISSSR